MSIASEISRLQTAKADLKTAIEGKGVTVSSSTKLDGYATLVNAIQTGGGGGGIGNLTKYQSVNVTPSESTNITINHTLGVVPKIVIVTISTANSSQYILNTGILGQTCGALITGDNTRNAYSVSLNTTGTANSNAYLSDTMVTIRRVTSSRYFDIETSYTIELYA